MKETKCFQKFIGQAINAALIIFVAMSVAFIATQADAKSNAGKKVLLIDSYHVGYPWSDGITAGVKEVLDKAGVEYKIINMDTKKNKSKEFKEGAALKAKEVIESYKPDVVIAADDNASKFLIKPYYKDASLPFVFCGVNWDASSYGFPYKNVTGMVEVDMIKELVNNLSKYAKGNKVGYLGGDNLSNKKKVTYIEKNMGIKFGMVKYPDSFDQWKKDFMEIQKSVDMVVIDPVSSMKDFDWDAAEEFAMQNSKIPAGTTQESLMRYSMIGMLKSPEEQGRWSANAALKILDGTSPAAIPIVKNKEAKMLLNIKIASKAGVIFKAALLKNAEIIK